MDGRRPSIVSRLRQARERHATRHRPSGFEFALADRIDYVNPAHWDALTADASVFASRAYLGALESAAPGNVRPRYAVAYRSGRPAVAVAMQLVGLGAADIVPRQNVDSLPAKAKSSLRGLVRAQVLVCGNLLAWGRHGVSFAPGIAPAEAWPAVAEALYRVRRAERLGGQTDFVLVKDLGDADAQGTGCLETYSYRAFETEPDMVLDLPDGCATLEDYFALLRSKYRKSAKSVLSDTDGDGYRLAPLPDLERHAPRLHELYLDVHSKAAVRLFVLSPAYLPRVATALGDRFRCVTLAKDDRIAGFVTVVKDGATAVAYVIGFDRAANESAPLYFRLLYAAVETALSMGCRRVSFGRTALEPKSRLGARPVPLRCSIRHRLPILNVALRRWLREVTHAEAPQHAAWKASPEV